VGRLSHQRLHSERSEESLLASCAFVAASLPRRLRRGTTSQIPGSRQSIAPGFNGIRVSANVYTSPDEIDQFCSAVEAIVPNA